MHIELLLKGLIIGFLIAIPIGPIDLLCIRMGLRWGLVGGFITGLGAAFADALYAAVAAFGAAALTLILMSHQAALQMIGGLLICGLGFRTLQVHDRKSEKEQSTSRIAYAFLFTFFLALTSPITILSFFAAYAALGIGMEAAANMMSVLSISLGVFLGSALWWLILSSGVSFLKKKTEQNYARQLHLLTFFSGTILLVFGFAAIAMALSKMFNF